MSKQGFSDLKITSSEKAPNAGYIRLKADTPNTLEYILETGEVQNISTPWELSVSHDDIIDPSTIVPSLYERHIIPVGAINDWSGHDAEIAVWNGSTWDFKTPKQSWIVWVNSANKLVGFDGTEWVSASGADLLATLGDVSFDKTYDDWFMPSKDELWEIYTQLHLHGIGGYPENGAWISYWCSSEASASSAWKLIFGTGEWHPGYSKTNFYNVIPVREFTSKISYSIRDRGPGGGYIYYKDGDYYQEALPEYSSQRWSDSGSSQHIPGTLLEIGSGSNNTNLIIADPSTTYGGAYYCAGVSKTYTEPVNDDIIVYDGTRWVNTPLGSPGRLSNLGDVFFRTVFDDWYIGSIDLMSELMAYVGTSYAGQGYEEEYFSSTEFDQYNVQCINFTTQSIVQRGKNDTIRRVRPVRDFEASSGSYAVGDEGPAGGTIFYIDGTTHYEVALQNAPDNYWSNIQDTLVGTSSAIGTGLTNTEAIVNQAGHTDSYALYCLNWIKTVAHDPENDDILRYNSSIEKWVVSKEEQETLSADDITVKTQYGFEKRSTEVDLQQALEINWIYGEHRGDYTFTESIFKDGKGYIPNDDINICILDGGGYADWDAAVYEFYSTIDLSPFGCHLTGNTTGTDYYFTSVYVNGLYRNSVTLPGGEYYSMMKFDTPTTTPGTYWLINRFESAPSNELTIKEIDIIVDSDSASIDGANIIGTNPHKELVTRDFVEKKTGKADEVTLQQILSDVEIDTNPDYQSIINSAWDPTVQTSGWVLQAGATYLNGVFGVSAGLTGQQRILTGDDSLYAEGGFFKLLVNQDVITNNVDVMFQDNVNEILIKPYGSVLTNTGDYELSFFIPTGFYFSEFKVYTSTALANDLELKFADMDLYPPRDATKIKEIDYIIDDDGQSIDGSDTPMTDAHRELTTRAYTDTLFASNAHWNKVSNVLTPADPNVEAIEWERNFNGYTRCTMKNTDDLGNSAGAVIELKGSGADYTNNVYIGKYGDSFWLPFLAGNGAVLTDKNLVVGTVTDGQEYRIVTGGGYTDPTQISYFDENGLHIISNKAASHPNIFVEEMKVASVHSASHLSVFVDTASGQLYSEAVPTYTPLTQTTEKFTITATDVSNGYIDVINVPNTAEHIFVYLNGVYMDLDSAGDYTLSSNRINFIVNIEVDDKVIVKYSY